MKKIVSLLLSAIMLLSAFSASATAYAANDTMSSAQSVNFGTTYYGTLSSSNQNDWYKFTTYSSGKITLKAENYNYGSSSKYELYDSNGNHLTYYYFDYNSALGYATGTEDIYVRAGTYYLKSYTNGSSNKCGNYTICLNYTNSNESFIDSSNADMYIGGAHQIELDKQYKGQLGVDDDVDFYKFVVPVSATVELKTTNYTNGSSSKYELYDSNGNHLTYYYFDYDSALGYATGSESIPLDKGTYYLKAYTNNSSYREGFYNFSLNLKVNLGTPSYLEVSKRKTTALSLSWGEVSGVSGYVFQVKQGNSWKAKGTSSNSITIGDLKPGSEYTFRVIAYKTINGKKYYGGWRYLTTATKPNTPSIKKPSTNKKHTITVKWNKVSSCSGYQVQFSKKKNFSSVIATKNVSGKNKTSYKGKNFTKGKKYYVRVRAYKKVDGTKYYSSWSKAKPIKCK